MTATAVRKLDQPTLHSEERPQPAEFARFGTLPPAGASPAGDLQRRLGEAALLGFYREDRSRTWLPRGTVAVVAGAGIVSWAAVFGMGWLLLG